MNDTAEQLEHLTQIVRWMIEHSVVRLNLQGQAEIQLSEKALSPDLVPTSNEEATVGVQPHLFAGVAPEDADPSDLCSCGHALSIMHTEAGCLKGCELHLCIPPATLPDPGQ